MVVFPLPGPPVITTLNGFSSMVRSEKKEGQAYHITPLQPDTLASFLTWGIHGELVVWDLPDAKVSLLSD
ncbi:hypothetical protein JCM30197_20410 [Schleiferia thermophila]|nr:hypothetical protein JCM30197_20410 [Schleiferia thermophila]